MDPFKIFRSNGKPPIDSSSEFWAKDHDKDSDHFEDHSPVVLEEDERFAPSDGNDGTFPRLAAKYKQRLWELGWTDGRLGQPDEQTLQFIDAQAKLRKSHRLGDIRQRVAELQAAVERLSKSITPISERLDRLREHRDQLWEDRLKDAYDPSVPLGLIYLLVALVLFIADLPLSLLLVAKGFDIEVVDKVTGLSVHQLFVSPLQVLRRFWEPMFLAMGIAFSGVFVKFFLDEVLDWRRPKTSDGEALPPRLRRGVVAFMYGVLSLFVVTMIVLGLFRAAHQKLPYDPNSVIPWRFLGVITFILLTLTLPVIGGICFSAGWRRIEPFWGGWKKSRQYYVVKHAVYRLEKKSYQPMLSELHQAEADLTAQKERFDQEDALGTDESLATWWRSLYEHGYSRGRTLPETLQDDQRIYPLVKKIRSKLLAKKLRAKLWDNRPGL